MLITDFRSWKLVEWLDTSSRRHISPLSHTAEGCILEWKKLSHERKVVDSQHSDHVLSE